MTSDVGTELHRIEAAGLIFSKIVYRPRAVLALHSHANAYLSFVSAGSYSEQVGRTTRECKASTLLYHAAGETHANHFHAEPVNLLRIEAARSSLLDRSLSAASVQGFRDEHTRYLCLRILRELQTHDDATPIALQGMVCELVAALARASRERHARGPAWLERVEGFLERSFAEPVDLAALAALAGVHPVHLARTYRKHFRVTIGERLRELRLQRAYHLLATTRESIGEIAHSCGFADQSHLARLVRRALGVSPSKYRAAHAQR